jgi:predicted SprT family Zn-dependent metalloprotease
MEKKLIEVHNLAFKLMDEFGLVSEGWGFRFNNRKNTLGCCTRTRYDGNYIQLSKYWVMELPMDEIVRTIKHEIAHALAPAKEGHGEIWKEMCRVVGIPDEAEKFHDHSTIIGFMKNTSKWKIECTTCGATNYANRKVYDKSCSKCDPTGWNEKYKLTWTINN